ncbi:MAG: hypothetical protein LBK00_07370 [Treponema sp.]|jgi:hypothetical protein|nr:hypothetical protein [Treponema sp.]
MRVNHAELLGQKYMRYQSAGRRLRKSPEWVFQTPANTVVGVSKEFASEQEARNDAVKDAARQIATYYGVYFSGYEEDTAVINERLDTIDRYTIDSSISIDHLIAQLTPLRFHSIKRRLYTVYALCLIPPREPDTQRHTQARVYAALEFNGSPLSEEDRVILRNGLLQALGEHRIPIQLSSPAQSGAYVFTVSIIVRKPAYEVDKDLREYYIALTFEGNGTSVTLVSETFSEMSYSAAMSKTALFIKTSGRFFQELRSVL